MNSKNPDTLSFTCGDCGKRLKAAPKLAGRRVRCPKCKSEVRVPGEKQSAAAATATKAKSAPAPEPTPATSPRSATAPTPATFPTKAADSANKELESPQDRPKTNFLEMDDPFSLAEPAIEDLNSRQEQSDRVRAAKEKKRRDEQVKKKRRQEDIDRRLATSSEVQGTVAAAERDKQNPVANKSMENPKSSSVPTATSSKTSNRPLAGGDAGSIPFDDEDAPPLKLESAAGEDSASARKSSTVESVEQSSSFDDEELQLAPLSEKASATPTKTPFLPPMDALDDLDDLVPDVGKSSALADELSDLDEADALEDAQYRVVCSTCGTAQYVSPSVKGLKIKCPDCFIDFKAPPPPKDWKPKKSKKLPVSAEIGLSPGLDDSEALTDRKQKLRTEQLLDRAREEAQEEDEEDQFQMDFDNSTFLQRTFGFFTDAITMGQTVLYAILFGGLFALAQVCLADTTSMFGKGMLLFATVFLPALGLLFALPMLSGGLALIESVANRQKVKEVPSFNIFENFGDLLVMFVAFAAGIVPGYLLGMAVGGLGTGALFFRAAGMVIVGVGLFPVFLLSMMDNGSIFAPISTSVFGSIRTAKESWGTYYIKTFCFTAGILLLWLIMLGRSPVLTGLAGAMLPLLIYFTCQQVGVLANDIAEHLSFEFQAPSDGDEEEAESEGRQDLLDEV